MNVIKSPGFSTLKYTIDPPFNAEPGDWFERDGNTIRQMRAGNEVDSRALPAGEPVVDFGLESAQQVSEVVLLRSNPMPAAAATLTDVQKSPAGVVTFFFSDSTSREYATKEDALTAVQAHDTSPDLAKDLLILTKLRRDPSLDNVDALNGSQCVVDGAAATPVLVNLAQVVVVP